MIHAYIISLLLSAIVFTGAFFLFQQFDYFKKVDAGSGGSKVPDMRKVCIYSAYITLPVLFLSMLFFYINSKRKIQQRIVYSMHGIKHNNDFDIPTGNFL